MSLPQSFLGINIFLNGLLANIARRRSKVRTGPERRQLEQLRKLFPQEEGSDTFTFLDHLGGTRRRKAPHKEMKVIGLDGQRKYLPALLLAFLLNEGLASLPKLPY